VGKKEKHVGKKVKGKQARRREEEGETAWKQRKKNAIAAVVVMFCTHIHTHIERWTYTCTQKYYLLLTVLV